MILKLPNSIPLHSCSMLWLWLWLLTFMTNTLPTITLAETTLIGRCGDCWCIPGNNGAGECPSDEIGIIDTFNLSDSILWSTFELTNADEASSFLTFDDEDCYPFADTIGPTQGYPESNGPQCTFPPSTSANEVCAYKFTEVQVCADRPYEVATYPSRQDAEDDGAVVTHEGGCGVCSSAQDLWARIKNYDNLEKDSVLCATSYVFAGSTNPTGRFDTLVKCFTDMGFTQSCSTLWAHSAATSALKCGGACAAQADGLTILNGPPPACAVAACLSCSSEWQDDFDRLAGRTLQNSGITERIARPCTVFARIIHDPCVSASERGEVITPMPTEAPTKASDAPTRLTMSLGLSLLVLGGTFLL